MVAGAWEHDGEDGEDTGAVKIYNRSGDDWNLQQTISDAATGFTSLLPHDRFGQAVAIDGDTVVVGAPGDDGHSGDNTGAVYVFTRSGSTWSLEQEIVDKSSGFDNLSSGDRFGLLSIY